MNMSINAYRKTSMTALSASQAELEVFRQVTARMVQARASSDPVALAHAVNENSRLWRVLQADLVAPENRLPDELKAGLISLSLWVERHAGMVLRDEKSIDALIDVNQSIIEGLEAQVRAQHQSQKPQEVAMAAAGHASVVL